MFKGSMTALVTPFRNGKVDEKAFADFVDWQIKEGTHALIPCGTTGESPTLSHAEHDRVIEICIEVSRGRAPVIAGAGSNSTEEAIRLSKHAQAAGADALLVVTPYYNKPNPEGQYLHFKAVAEAVNLPVFIYNIPGRSVIDMSVATMARLAALPNIVGVKDATADLVRPLKVRTQIGPEFIQLSGEDATVTAFLAQGGVGCISVTANVAPNLCSQLHTAWMEGDFAKVWELRDRLMPLHDAMFCEPNPGPAKYAASLLGRVLADCRLPLAPLAAESKAKVEAAMQKVGLL
ncbi:4-hydroxy-tetrahydrodipicolinate synthase [Oleispirillum naphthae]|uniref:4-hydroxy-tetrahydrodipicolinate synthase n=1 Tax=Oleispirillum naphthae TaxID=2838853 RepID=UPI00308232C8